MTKPKSEASSRLKIRPTETTDLPTAHERGLQRAYQEMTVDEAAIKHYMGA